MAAYKDTERNTWYVAFYYRDWQGNNKKKKKRGFKTKREALDWEKTFRQKQEASLDMLFIDFVEVYAEDMKPRLKYNTWLTKEHIIKTKLLPYFGNKKMNEIKAADVVRWQNEMMSFRDEDGNGYSKVYLKTLQSQLSAIFNHGIRLYELKENPVRKAGSMGGERRKEMLVWTKEEYKKFSEAIIDKPQAYYAFEVLFWTGLRVGELLALTPADIDFSAKTISVTKSYQRIKGEDYITDPKTEKSNRTVSIPDFLCEELQEYLAMLYGFKDDDRMFQITKSFLHHEMIRGSEKAGVKRIRIHDIRHSHVSMLIDMGFSAVDIAGRMGHESIDITLHYAHMFPSAQKDMAEKLNMERVGGRVCIKDQGKKHSQRKRKMNIIGKEI